MSRRPFVALISAVAAGSIALPGTAAAQLSSARAPVTAELRGRIVDSLTTTVESLYPAPDTGRVIAEHVRRRAAAGAYATTTDAALFARLLTQDLQTTNQDTHLVVDFAAPQSEAAPVVAHGIERVERLDGNVGYMRFSSFPGGDAALRAVENALRYLETTDAIIIDLRNSRGGSASNFLISHFTGPDTIHSLTVYNRRTGQTRQRYTLAQVPGPRRPDVPLYILVDDITRSAAEDVAFVLQNIKRTTLVGGQTAGAGRNNTIVPLGEGFVASVSFTRVMEPGTGREWERTGVTPDVRVPAESALGVAHALALDTLAARAASPARKQELALTAATVRAAVRASPGSASQLTQFAGTYEGGQYVTLSAGRLIYQPRVAQPRTALTPIDARTFASAGTRYVFEVAVGTVTLRITAADGTSSTYARTSATVPPPRR